LRTSLTILESQTQQQIQIISSLQ